MKKLGFVIMIAAMLFALAACGAGAPANDPKSVAVAFLDRMKNMDLDGAKQLATADGAKMLDMVKGLMAGVDKAELDKQKAEGAQSETKILDVKEEGDKATVQYSQKEGETSVLEMVKENGQWKVNFKKSM